MRRTKTTYTAISGTELQPDGKLCYPVEAAAEVIGISSRRLWDLIRDKKIKSFKAEGRRLISRTALETYVTEREAAGDEDAA
jgi:excisionase family DNA binding protein